MKITDSNKAITDELVMNTIYLIRGKKVMLDRDLAALYQMEKKLTSHDADIALIFNYLKKLLTPTNIVKYARRQGFPDDFLFENKRRSYKRIGKAIPVHMGKWIGEVAICILKNKKIISRNGPAE